LILKTYLIILIYIKVLKTIYNTSQTNILKIKILSGQLAMASGVARLASDQGLLAMASWVARLTSDEGLLAAASCLARLGERWTDSYGFIKILTKSHQSHHVKPQNDQEH